MSDIDSRIHRILSNLADVREELLDLSDAIWRAIDHNDPAELERGFNFKQAYNEKRAAFDLVAGELSEIVREYAQGDLAPEAVLGEEIETEVESDQVREVETLPEPSAEAHIVEGLHAEVQYGIDDDFAGRSPFGFVLEERVVTGLRSWEFLYLTFLQEMAKRNWETFSGLPEVAVFQPGDTMFSRDSGVLRKALQVTEEMYAEGDLSVTTMLDNIRVLLAEFGIPADALKVMIKVEKSGVVESRTLESAIA